MSQVHAMIREGWEKTDQAYQAEKHAQLLQALAGLLVPHLGELIQSKAKSALNDFMLSDEFHNTLGRMVDAKVTLALNTLNDFTLSDEFHNTLNRMVTGAINDLNDRDADGVRALVREELENQADDFDNRVNQLIDDRDLVDQDDLEQAIRDIDVEELLQDQELVTCDKLEDFVHTNDLEDRLAEYLGTFAQGDTMREKIQDALQEMNFSVSVSRY